MSSCWKMSYASAPTPPSTPTFIPTHLTKTPLKQTKSGKYLQNPFSINCNLPTPITTTLDISSHHNQSPLEHTPIQYDYSDNDDDDDDNDHDDMMNQMTINNPPQIRLTQTESHYIIHSKKYSNYNLLPTTIDTDGEEDIEQEPSQSSLCCTLYPYETETIKTGIHYTKTMGRRIIVNNYDESQLEGSPSRSLSKPVHTAALFGNKFPKVEYLSIINDDNNNQETSIQLPPIPSTKGCRTPFDDDDDDINYRNNNNNNNLKPLSPATEISESGMTSFPDPLRFKRKPPPRKQSFNQYEIDNPFSKNKTKRSNSFQHRHYVLNGTDLMCSV